MEISDLLAFTQKNKASDLHLSTDNPPVLRVQGDMLPYKTGPLSADAIKTMLYGIMTEQQRAEYEQDFEIDFAISTADNSRFRVNAFNTMTGPAAVFRAIPSDVITLQDLGVPDIIKRLCLLPKGLVLITGPTGSGKSTTLAAMVHCINNELSKHIITIEDPIEFVHKSRKSLINQREVGKSTRSFARALKSALREDPDVILVGEMRDRETIHLALTAAETGHLVLATLHTNSAPKAIDRIIDVFPAEEKEMVRAMLSVSLEAVITQTLLKRKTGGGRVAAFEIMLGTPAVRNLIREGKIPQLTSLIQMGDKLGMCTMRDSVQELITQGVVSEAVAKTVLNYAAADESEDSSGEFKQRQSTRRPLNEF